MSKRLILAIALSFLVMMTWARLTQKFYPIERQEVTERFDEEEQRVAETVVEPTPSFIPADEKEAEVLVSAFSHNRELVFNLPSASLKKIIFSQFGDYALSLNQGFYLPEQNLIFTQERLDFEEAIFVYQDEERRITKHFNYSDPNFIITLDIKIENLSEQPVSYPSSLILGTMDFSPKQLETKRAGFQLAEVFLKEPDKILRLSPRKETKKQHSGEFFGFRDNYFCAILIPITFPETLQIIPINCTRGFFRMNCAKSQLSLSRPMVNLQPNQIGHLQYRIYLGPQQADLLKSFEDGAQEVIYYGIFDPIAKLLLRTLQFFSRLVHNWGWAIIILSILIYFILFPLSLKQMRSAKEMQHLQPKIEELRRLYKDNPQRMNKEVLELYRKHKINPLGGCLPMILQIPIFFSFYLVLMRLLELKGAGFLWIKDLSQPDRLIASPEINILPILMAITMFLQQKFSMMPTTGSSGEQQRLMTFLMPIMFGFIFYRMSSGLVLYWFVNSLLMFIYQMKIKVASEPIKH